MLTLNERARLEGKESKNDNSKVSESHRRYNDMIVRKKVLQWLEDSQDVLFALEKLPRRQIKKYFDDEEDGPVFDLSNVIIKLISTLDFDKIQGNNIEDAVATRLIYEGGRWEKLARKAERRDFERNIKLNFLIQALSNHSHCKLADSPALEEYFRKNFLDSWKVQDDNGNLIPLRYYPKEEPK